MQWKAQVHRCRRPLPEPARVGVVLWAAATAFALLAHVTKAAAAGNPRRRELLDALVRQPDGLALRQAEMRRSQAPPAAEVLRLRVIPGEVKQKGCSQPINQFHYRLADSKDPKSTILGFWLGAWGEHDNLLSDGWGPGRGGAACRDPPNWGPRYQRMRGSCVAGSQGATKSDWFYQLFNFEDVHSKDQLNVTDWMEVVTRVTAYLEPTAPDGSGGRLQRVELTTDLWTSASVSGGPEFKQAAMMNGIGRSAEDLVPGTVVYDFQAPKDHVLGDIKVSCGKDKATKVKFINGMDKACAMEPKWHPKPYKTMEKAQVDYYNCQPTKS